MNRSRCRSLFAALCGLALAPACGDDSSVGSGSASETETTGSTTTDTDATATDGGTCGNGMQDGDETDIDCGGSCVQTCGSGQGCGGDDDCSEGTVCTDAGACGEGGGGNCEDGVQNGDETDVDCGGSCPTPCGTGGGCSDNGDCESGVCDALMCQDPTCEDGVQNGDESDVDCGGSCEGCDDGESCSNEDDCASGMCDDGECTEASCDDGVQNGDESDVDCGGSCPDDCATGGGCTENDDCETGACDERAGMCVAPTCTDTKLGGDETDVDCGGSCGATCDNGDDCEGDDDCISDRCDPLSQTCADQTCFDGAQNQTETDVDCGGICGPTCDAGEMCDDLNDCLSLSCNAGGTCNPSDCSDLIENGDETDVDCGGSTCPGCDDGLDCTDSADCASGVCDSDGLNVCLTTLSVSASPPCSNFDGAGVQLTATAMDGTGTYTYSWTPTAGLDDPTSATPIASPSGFETYTVTVDDGVNQFSDSVTVVNTSPFNLEDNCTLYTSTLLAVSPGEASIVYSGGGTVACEEDNNDFGLHLCEGVVFQEASLTGTIGVQAGAGDNDWIGLVWNAQSNSEFYSLVWKRSVQSVFGCSTPAGIVVKRVSAPNFAAVDGTDIYCPNNTTDSQFLVGPASTTADGWEAGQLYDVTIAYSDAAGGSQVTVVRQSDSSVIADFMVADTTYPTGAFGSTTLSQEQACTGPLNATCQ